MSVAYQQSGSSRIAPPVLSDESLNGQSNHDLSIGQLIRQANNLSEEQLKQIFDYQRANGLRFGEAAVALGLASEQDIVFALSQQFHYPYTPEARRHVNPELVVAAQPFSQQAEDFRSIRSQLTMRIFNPTEPKRALAIVSPDSGDGKTYFAANLAVALAQLGGRTLVVDADLRSPRLHNVYGIQNTSGLSGLLSGRQESNVIYQAPDIPSLYIMPVGVVPPNPSELLERPAFRLLIGELIRKFDHILVDTPAAHKGSDAAAIAARCGSALLLAKKGSTRMIDMENLSANIANTNAKLAGVILNEH